MCCLYIVRYKKLRSKRKLITFSSKYIRGYRFKISRLPNHLGFHPNFQDFNTLNKLNFVAIMKNKSDSIKIVRKKLCNALVIMDRDSPFFIMVGNVNRI